MKSFAFALMAVAVYAQTEEDSVPDFDALIENGEDGMLISPMNPNADGSMDMDADVVKMEKVFGILTDLVDLFCYDIFNEEGMNDNAESFVTTAEVEGIETATNTLMDTMRSVDMDFDESTMPMMEEMDPVMACERANYLLGEVQAYNMADEDGKREKEDEW